MLKGLSRTTRKGLLLLSVGFTHWSAYRFMILIWGLSGITPFIMLAIWHVKAQLNGGTLNGMTASAFLSYFIAVWLSQHLVYAWVAHELDWQIRSGELSQRLLKPIHPFWETLAIHFAERFVRFPMMLLVVVVASLFFSTVVFVFSTVNIILYIVSIHLAFIIRFLMSYCVGLLAFWFNQTTALEDFYYIVFPFASGIFAPLVFYPQIIQNIFEKTPFPYLIYYPVRILMGDADTQEILQIIVTQCIWFGLFALTCLLLWRSGLKRYGAVGS